jgi:uncharacterized protein YbbC (DUF1343 family)
LSPILLAAFLAAAKPTVRVGLEVVEAQGGKPLLGKRVGLVAQAASVTANGRHAVDVLRALGVDVRRLFGPEHGFRGNAAAGESVAGGIDAASGLPVTSLYGERNAPSPEDLEGLDVLVIDLQDAGVRFYTYAATLVLCLGAAAEAGTEVVVLDRPNPLGGDYVDGPLKDPTEDVPERLLNLAPGPLVHGLTLGEMARLANARSQRPARLTVVPMAGWKRSMTWSDTGRSWRAPSPNLRSAEAALVYPGTCLLEATNVAEGRGTDAPFLLFGSPWLRPVRLRAALHAPGLRLRSASFVPVSSWAALEPKHLGVRCAGLRIHVEDAHAVQPYAFGLALLAALRATQPEFAWRDDGGWLDTLLATRRVRIGLERGDAVEAIRARDAEGLRSFRRERESVLLYD